MSRLPVRPRNVAFASLFLAFPIGALAQRLYFDPVPRDIIEARLQKYKGTDNEREATLKQLFAEVGCDGANLSEVPVRESKLPNVVCVLPGTSGKSIIVGAHYDHVSSGDGVVDNWSGASLLPSLYQAVRVDPRKHSFIFIGFTDEEKGLVGSRRYAREMTKEQVATTDAMINMDTLGLAPTEVWTSHSDKALTGTLAYVAKQLNVPVTGMNVEEVGTTDSVEFSDRKIPSITIHSLTQQSWNAHILHSSKDKLSSINVDDYYQTYRLLSAYLVFLDQEEPSKGSKHR